MMMQLLQLEYFRTVAELEHFSKAAERLHISQSSLSSTISKLEEELGVKLFERVGRRVRLSQCGASFYNNLNRMFMNLEAGKQELLDLMSEDRGTVSIAVPVLGLIPSCIRTFFQEHPNVQFREALLSPEAMKESLLNGRCDYALAFDQLNEPGITWECLAEEEIFLIVPAEHPLANRKDVELQEFSEDRFVNTTLGHSLDDQTIELCRSAGFIPSFAFSGPEIAKSLVAQGIGVAFISELELQTTPFYSCYVCPDAKGNLPDENLPHVLRIRNPQCKRTLGVATLEGRYKSLAAQRFMELLRERFRPLGKTIS